MFLSVSRFECAWTSSPHYIRGITTLSVYYNVAISHAAVARRAGYCLGRAHRYTRDTSSVHLHRGDDITHLSYYLGHEFQMRTGFSLRAFDRLAARFFCRTKGDPISPSTPTIGTQFSSVRPFSRATTRVASRVMMVRSTRNMWGPCRHPDSVLFSFLFGCHGFFVADPLRGTMDFCPSKPYTFPETSSPGPSISSLPKLCKMEELFPPEAYSRPYEVYGLAYASGIEFCMTVNVME
ncbi:hypothetical protein EV421DRAFT_1739818 [Armillaria borealis]|uniref:Uncharacterized protein n=1 Tax=Armillaria borealis TaxID=47425 RepID=A0AA39J654_9AGAR|nr:hypothetical protein EV421DRAFT_1739818 [Armillaria borealis]